MSLRPHCKSTDFYLRPFQNASNQSFSAQPVGRHKLSQIVKDICRKGGLPGFRSNHSLRASSATRMYDACVDEQLICEVTGHRSNAVRSYKRTNQGKKEEISKVIQGIQSDNVNMVNRPKSTNAQQNLSITLNINV